MTQELKPKQAQILRDAINSKVLAEEKYNKAVQRQEEILTIICESLGIENLLSARLEGNVLEYEVLKEEDKKIVKD